MDFGYCWFLVNCIAFTSPKHASFLKESRFSLIRLTFAASTPKLHSPSPTPVCTSFVLHTCESNSGHSEPFLSEGEGQIFSCSALCCDLALALGKDSAFLLPLVQWAAILLILLRQPSEHRNSWIFPTLSKDT